MINEYVCKECNKLFHRKDYLTKHLESLDHKLRANPNAEKNVLRSIHCDKCYKSFVSMANYERHFERCKETRTPLQCNHCDRVFKHASSKSKHMKTCSKNSGNITNEINVTGTNGDVTIHNVNDNSTNTNNVFICNFGQESLRFEPQFLRFISRCIDRKENGIYDMIDFIHFNESHPENMNIRKAKYKNFFDVYKGGSWNLELSKTLVANILNNQNSIFQHYVHKCSSSSEERTVRKIKDFVKCMSASTHMRFEVPFEIEYEFSQQSHRNLVTSLKQYIRKMCEHHESNAS